MKKIICLIIILLNLISVPVLSASVSLSENAQNELYSYGIMRGDGNGDLRLEDNITRAEFCKMICVSLGYGNAKELNHSVVEDYYDVDINHWAYDYIQLSRNLGLTDGFEPGYFKPDENIIVQDTIKIIVTALGYKPKAEGEGYPNGYINIAEKIGLINKSDFKFKKNASRQEVAYLIHSCLDIPILSLSSFGKDAEYVVMDGTNNIPLLTLRNGITQASEKIEDNTNEEQNTVPHFNGPEYSGRLAKISNLQKTGENYYFNNSLDINDTSTYIITKDTYVYLNENTLGLSEIKNDMYVQCWHYTDDKDNIELLKIELMKKEPFQIFQ